MNTTNDDSRVLLFPSCDRDGLLLDALGRADDGPATRADAMLFGWMLGLDASVDAVGAARAVLAVAAQRERPADSPYRRALVDGLRRFVADRGRVASLSMASATGGIRPRRRLRDREGDERSVVTSSPTTERRGDGADNGTRRQVEPRD